MRLVTVPLVPFDGALLTTELIAAGVPMRTPPAIPVLGDDIFAEGDSLNVAVNTDPDTDLHDSTVAAVVAMHVKPPEQTPRERAIAAAKLLLDAIEANATIDRAVTRMFAKRFEILANWLNSLRTRCGNAGVNVANLPVLPVVTPAQFFQNLKEELDLD